MDYSLSERFRSLMEDCRVMATGQFLVLVPNDSPEHLISNVRTALVASTLRLQSLDHAKKRYVHSELEDPIEVDPNLALYQKCYFASKRHIEGTIRKYALKTEGSRPSVSSEPQLCLKDYRQAFFRPTSCTELVKNTKNTPYQG